MAYIAPNTWITLCKNVPLDNSYDHQLTFANVAAQRSYFISKKVVELSANSYQRVMSNKLRIACTMAQAVQCNYLYFSNDSFENKWFYAFITGWEYINNVTTEITYEIDVFQSFWFDVDIKPSFVEREHDNTDTMWANTVPENLEIGEYVSNYETALQPSNSGAVAIFYTNFNDDAGFTDFMGGTSLVGGVFTGLNVIIKSVVFDQSTQTCEAQSWLESVINANKKDGIIAMYMCPFVPSVWYIYQETVSISKVVSSLDGYQPNNNKLYTYPYCLLHIQTDVQGADFRYEFFNDANNNCTFVIKEALIPSPTLTLIPTNYAGGTAANRGEFRLTLSEFPQCSWNADVWKVYLAQNAASLPTKMISELIHAGAGVIASGVTGGVVGTMEAASSLTGIAQTLAQIHDIQTKPPQQNGTQTAMADYGMGYKNFIAERLSIRAEFARIIDNYFDMFGYATHRVKIPNITGRPYWNYVKTQGVVLDIANAPQPYIQKMIDCFNRGITFWHNPANVGNYNLDNRPV